MDNFSNKDLLKSLGLNKDIMQQANKLASLTSSVNQMIPKYGFISGLNESGYKDASEVIKEEEADLTESVDFTDSVCKVCGTALDSRYYWYYLKHCENNTRSFSVCCLSCLKDYYNDNKYEIDNYEIIEYSRCSAYYKCKDLGNIRGRCERSKNLTAKSRLIPIFTNFCESAQAGVILSTHKMNEVFKNFSEQSLTQSEESKEVLKASALQNKQQFEESTKMLKESGRESKRQFNITLVMTALTIVLTVVNIVIAVLTYKNNDVVNELKELNTQISDINKNINTLNHKLN